MTGIVALLSGMPAWGQSVAVHDLAEAGPLSDLALGSHNSKVTIIECVSLTCSHCASFHKETLPELKSRYIDTRNVRSILREFPLDPLATAAFMLARSNGEANYYAIVELLFSQ